MNQLFKLFSYIFIITFLTCCGSDDPSDPCDEVSCQNDGTCVDGTCDCPAGFEGEFCETPIENACDDVVCENGGNCISGTCNCPEGFEGDLCEIEIDLCDDIVCQNDGTCVDGTCQCPAGTYGEFCESISELDFQTEWGSLETLEVRVNGIYAIWWSPDFDHADEAETMFEYLNQVRDDCLNLYGMEDPPNPGAGYFYNVYVHHGEDETVLPTYWGNGQGTDTYGMPFLTIPAGFPDDLANLSHEGFHIFQYNSNSPGFEYAGDSQWYIEASAQWYMSQNVPDETNTFIEAGAISGNPQLALWHSFSNEADGDPTDWYYQVRQYGMHLLLYYLTEEASIDPDIVTSGFYEETDLSPQEFIYTNVGGENLRTYFADWSAHNVGGFDYIADYQLERAQIEEAAAGDPANKNPYAIELSGASASGTYSPPAGLRPRGWSYNVIKINNSQSTTYSFDLAGDETGSEGAASHFEARITVVDTEGTPRYITVDMDDALNGSASVNVDSDETEVYFNVVAVPEHFGSNQTYDYEVTISQPE